MKSSPTPFSRVRARLLAQCRCAAAVTLVLDYDGTLVGLHPNPAMPRLSPRERACLARLRAHPQVQLCIVTGRAIGDIERRVRLANVYYIGNHGVEIRYRGQWLFAPRPAWTRSMVRISQAVHRHPFLRTLLIETKGPVLAVHFRGRPRAQWKSIRRRVRQQLRPFATSGFRLHDGKGLVELRPATIQSKGWAVRHLIQRGALPPMRNGHVLIAIGDDRTDETMFRVLSAQAVTVHVGRHVTAARYRMATMQQVWRFLRELAETLERPLTRPSAGS